MYTKTSFKDIKLINNKVLSRTFTKKAVSKTLLKHFVASSVITVLSIKTGFYVWSQGFMPKPLLSLLDYITNGYLTTNLNDIKDLKNKIVEVEEIYESTKKGSDILENKPNFWGERTNQLLGVIAFIALATFTYYYFSNSPDAGANSEILNNLQITTPEQINQCVSEKIVRGIKISDVIDLQCNEVLDTQVDSVSEYFANKLEKPATSNLVSDLSVSDTTSTSDKPDWAGVGFTFHKAIDPRTK